MAQVLDFFAEFAAKIEEEIPESDPNAHRYYSEFEHISHLLG